MRMLPSQIHENIAHFPQIFLVSWVLTKLLVEMSAVILENYTTISIRLWAFAVKKFAFLVLCKIYINIKWTTRKGLLMDVYNEHHVSERRWEGPLTSGRFRSCQKNCTLLDEPHAAAPTSLVCKWLNFPEMEHRHFVYKVLVLCPSNLHQGMSCTYIHVRTQICTHSRWEKDELYAQKLQLNSRNIFVHAMSSNFREFALSLSGLAAMSTLHHPFASYIFQILNPFLGFTQKRQGSIVFSV